MLAGQSAWRRWCRGLPASERADSGPRVSASSSRRAPPPPLPDTSAMDRRPIIALLLLVVCVHSGFSVICYQCNSQYDPRCGDPFDPYTLGEVNCSMKPPLEHLGKIQPTICRKIVQRVYGKTRVVRGCGYLTDDSNPDGRTCIQRSGTHDVHVQYCTCSEDRCNSARSRSGPEAGTLLAIALLAAGAGAGASASAAPSAL